MMAEQDRAWFDEQLEAVLEELPPLVKNLMDEVPLVVEDYPSAKQLRSLGLSRPEELQGLYVGVSIDKKSFEAPQNTTDTVYLYRLGNFNRASEEDGTVFLDRLRDEIRKTILHEYGHHHGMDEDELEELGY